MPKGGPLLIYVDPSHITPGFSFTTLLYPFFGLGADKTHNLYLERALSTHGFDKNCFKLVDSSQEAEYIVMPHEYWRLLRKRPDVVKKIIEDANRWGKPLLIDASGDVAGVVRVPNAKVLRINMYRFDAPEYEIKVPVLSEDLLETACSGQFVARKKGDIATIGFVGWAGMPLKQHARSFIKEIPIRLRGIFDANYRAKIKGVFWRAKVNKIFERSKRVNTQFIIRSFYSGTALTAKGDFEKNRKEFIDNILNTDYSLVVRGDANEAARFYETISLGRIPVLIDTAVVLPLEDEINYREFCVIIDHTQANHAPDILADFHAKLTPEAYEDMQRKARRAFEQYLRYDSFSPYLVELLRN